MTAIFLATDWLEIRLVGGSLLLGILTVMGKGWVREMRGRRGAPSTPNGRTAARAARASVKRMFKAKIVDGPGKGILMEGVTASKE